ncbi:hypothetical protein HNP37_000585 [Flavobacterium nitrogenifigens]|uniref:YcxB-like protein n=2 Tax=Flavobacterium TaxID=237 RepID=A0A7W7IU18_9FLAO|nr:MULTISPECIES: YcxB family protein [Flavobacterium]MBB4800546.1 hypothetical protein [Flavobacterium nitrogenifigens]MBB6385704.1 hypothetical protein [Flavobacterium notoginsengisoli]
MELNYSLTENDYLQQQLYLASKSKLIEKQRKISRLLVFVLLLVIGLLFFITKNMFLAYYFGIASIICFLLFPFYLKKYYYKLFKKYVNENFRNRIGIVSKIIFKEDTLEAFSEGIGNSVINFSVFENISEIQEYIFIGLKTNSNLIIPKNGIENVAVLREELKKICNKIKIEFISELDWKWK